MENHPRNAQYITGHELPSPRGGDRRGRGGGGGRKGEGVAVNQTLPSLKCTDFSCTGKSPGRRKMLIETRAAQCPVIAVACLMSYLNTESNRRLLASAPIEPSSAIIKHGRAIPPLPLITNCLWSCAVSTLWLCLPAGPYRRKIIIDWGLSSPTGRA